MKPIKSISGGTAILAQSGRSSDAAESTAAGREQLLSGASQWAWLPVPLLLLALLALWAIDLPDSYPAPAWFLFVLQFTCMFVPAAVIAFLIARSFLAGGAVGLLFLGCGAIFFGLAGVVANALSRGDINTSVTIHNLCAWLSAICHLAGVVLFRTPLRTKQVRGWWLLGASGLTLAAIGLVVTAARAGWMPAFFVQGEGGLLPRQIVLGSAAAMFAATGVYLMAARARASAFERWYGVSLLLIASGLLGVLLQTVHSSLLGWVGVGAQLLGGVYLLLAAITAARESHAEAVSIASMPEDSLLRYCLALAIVVLAVSLKLLFLQALEGTVSVLLLYPAVILSALYGGRGPGLLAAALAVVAFDLFWTQPMGTLSLMSSSDFWGATLFLATSTAMVFIIDAMQRGEARVQAARTQLIIAAEREKTVDALHDSEERYRAVVDNVPALIGYVDLQHRYLFNNARYEEWFGIKPDQLAGRHMRDVLGEDIYRHRLPYIERILQGETVRFEGLAHHARLGVRDVELAYAPCFSTSGKVQGFYVMSFDITDRKRAESALKEADRRKDEFLATLSHELRNPLAPLTNALHLLRLTGDTGSAATPIREMMERQVNHLVRLVDDLLEMSRISRGTLELRKERVQVATILRNAVETIEPMLKAARHQLTVNAPEEPLWLEGDPVRLAQILSNLLNNAAKYTEPGGEILLLARREDHWISISVRDNGAGISDEVLPRIFEMFSRGDRPVGRGDAGLGIGLPLALRLAQMHGGTLEACSEGRGRGSEFTLRLPLAERQQPLPAAAESTNILIPRKRILVVDDNFDAGDTLAMLLQCLGAEVRVARDGLDALALFAAYDPEVVLLDIGMPGMDGYEVARRVRASGTGHRAFLVAITGWGQEQDRERARSAGFDHHLTKPADLRVLQDLLALLDVPQSSASTR